MSAAQTTDSNYLSSLLAVTQDGYVKMVQDNVNNKSATLFLIKEKSQVDMRSVAGNQVQIPLMVEGNTTVDSYKGYDLIDTTPQKGLVDAYLPWAYYSGSITISRQEQKENSGESKIADLLGTKMKQVLASMTTRVNYDLLNDAGTGNGGKNLTGLPAICPQAVAASAGAYAGITNAKWRHAPVASASASTAIITDLDLLYYGLTDGSDVPDIILSNGTGFAAYAAANRQAGVGISYVNTKLADAGFATMAYMGIPMVLDQAVPNSTAGSTKALFYMLNSSYLGFKFNDSEVTPFVRAHNQNAETALVNLDCQLATNRRGRQGILYYTA